MVATRIVATVFTTSAATLLCAASPALADSGSTDVASTVPSVASETQLGAQDTEFRALFANWKSLENRETGRIAIPSRKPVDHFKLTSQYGFRADPFAGRRARHKGVDMAGPIGTPIYATADGIVGRAQWVGGYGKYVEVEHGGEIQTRYGHMSEILVQPNQRVTKGQVIGLMGSTGRSTGSHLHYEVRIAGNSVNPMPFISSRDYLLAINDGGRVAQGGPAE
ncbi:M23 family metallopeptidase [Blastomonas sp.]|uniref:M23 family metallopeptidase n=1 Tax=Blastomonas sp. TaxID=1909299 RepID=UPI0026093264|nr:M23 family metallopeptidase [Blastomonas sp.]MDM7956238.1 M23 family metallopeptidase [Blastomonas sp.]